MKLYFTIFLFLGLLTCHKTSEGKSAENSPLSCTVKDLPNGFELTCDGVPHQCLNGKDGAIGPAGHNGGPGAKGDKGDKGDPGSGGSGRSVAKVQVCHTDWDGVPTYSIDYTVFTYTDGVKESSAIVEITSAGNEIETNSAIWAKDDPRSDQAQVDVGGFGFTQTGDSAVVLYRSTGRTSEMTCHQGLHLLK